MSDLAVWAIIAAAALWVIGMPLLYWRLARSGALERQQAKRDAAFKTRRRRETPSWVYWLTAFWVGHFINWAVFMAVGQVLRAAGVDLTTGPGPWVVIVLFLTSWVATSRSLRRSFFHGNDSPEEQQVPPTSC